MHRLTQPRVVHLAKKWKLGFRVLNIAQFFTHSYSTSPQALCSVGIDGLVCPDAEVVCVPFRVDSDMWVSVSWACAKWMKSKYVLLEYLLSKPSSYTRLDRSTDIMIEYMLVDLCCAVIAFVGKLINIINLSTVDQLHSTMYLVIETTSWAFIKSLKRLSICWPADPLNIPSM
mgnify:CR=1 FL=1